MPGWPSARPLRQLPGIKSSFFDRSVTGYRGEIEQVSFTLALASLAASASAAMALCSWTGSRTSLLEIVIKAWYRVNWGLIWKYMAVFFFHFYEVRLLAFREKRFLINSCF